MSSFGIFAQAVVKHDDAQRVEQLPLVFVDAFDLAVEDRVGIDATARTSALSQSANCDLGLALGLAEGVAEAASSASGLSLASCVRSVIQPSPMASVMSVGERRVGQQQPAPRRDAVGLVVESLGEHLGEILARSWSRSSSE